MIYVYHLEIVTGTTVVVTEVTSGGAVIVGEACGTPGEPPFPERPFRGVQPEQVRPLVQ
jgi:hypothetical protein